MTPREYLAQLADGSFGETLLKQADAEAGRLKNHDPVTAAYWIRYILTTAYTWKTPLRDFELQVRRR